MFIKFLISLFLHSVQIYGHNLFTTLPIFPKQQQQPREREGGGTVCTTKDRPAECGQSIEQKSRSEGGGGGGQEGEGAGRVKAKVKKWQVGDKR